MNLQESKMPWIVTYTESLRTYSENIKVDYTIGRKDVNMTSKEIKKYHPDEAEKMIKEYIDNNLGKVVKRNKRIKVPYKSFELQITDGNHGLFDLAKLTAQIRLEGKEFAKKRPSILTSFTISHGHRLIITPQVESSPDGWKISDEILIYVDGMRKLTLQYKDGIITPARGYIFKTEEDFFNYYGNTLKAFLLIWSQPEKITGDRTHCLICGKHLSDQISLNTGFGSHCRQFYASHLGKIQDIIIKLTEEQKTKL